METGVRVQLLDGVAHHMGEGVFVLTQRSDAGTQDVVVTEDDLKAMLELIRSKKAPPRSH